MSHHGIHSYSVGSLYAHSSHLDVCVQVRLCVCVCVCPCARTRTHARTHAHSIGEGSAFFKFQARSTYNYFLDQVKLDDVQAKVALSIKSMLMA